MNEFRLYCMLFLIIIVFGSTRRRLMIISSIQRLHSPLYMCIIYEIKYKAKEKKNNPHFT